MQEAEKKNTKTSNRRDPRETMRQLQRQPGRLCSSRSVLRCQRRSCADGFHATDIERATGKERKGDGQPALRIGFLFLAGDGAGGGNSGTPRTSRHQKKRRAIGWTRNGGRWPGAWLRWIG